MKREELLVNAKPILFNTEMVKAILEGRKTVTRRIVKRQHLLLDDDCKHEMGFFDTGGNDWACRKLGCGIINTGKSIFHAPYQVGDILYVRETYSYVYEYGSEEFLKWEMKKYVYKTDENLISSIKWKPSIHMPKEAARIFLKVTNVRVERLQDMNIDDIEKEGVYCDSQHDKVQGLLLRFIRLWDSTINKQDFEKYEWYANPYVWVIEFEKINLEDNHNN